MKYLFLLLMIPAVSCGQTYYIVRHAEKESQGIGSGSMMTNDPPLSAAGKTRAVELKELLKNKNIHYIFSTNTIRAKTTAQPTADYFGLKIEVYGPVPDSAFINKLRSLKKNTLIAGHSNTVDDIVNMLCNEVKVAGDLKDSEYDNLFMVKKKRNRYIFSRKPYGLPAQ